MGRHVWRGLGVPGDPPPAHLTNYHNIVEGVPATPIRETGRLG